VSGFGTFAMVAAALGATFALAAFACSRLARVLESRDATDEALLAAGALLAFVLLVDQRRVLRWSYGLELASGRLELPGVGRLLGLVLLATLGGALMLAAPRLAGPGGRSRWLDPRVLGRRLLILAVGFVTLAGGVLIVETLRAGDAALRAAAGALVGIVLGAIWLGGALALLIGAPVRAEPAPLAGRARRATAVAAALAALAAAATFGQSWLEAGTYATAPVAASVSAALVGLAAMQPARFASLRTGLLAVVLMGLLVSR
jgi:hypothetical protein